MASVFEGIFKEYELQWFEREPALDEKGNRLRDDDGNWAWTTTPRVLRVFLKQAGSYSAAQIQEQYGVDDKSIILEGRCIDPVQPPAELLTGEMVQVEVDGRQGEFRIIRSVPSPLEILTELLGQKFHGTWRPK